MAKAAALMTDTEVDVARPRHGVAAALQQAVAETMYANIKTVGLPQWSEADQTLAKALQKELKVPENGLATKLRRCAAASRCPTRTSAAAARTTSATSRGTCRRSRCAIPSNIPAGCRATTGRTRSPWRRRSRTRA